jgi:hypothetical protein
MDKRLYFELMVELSHKDTWVHYYFVCYKTFVIFSFYKCFITCEAGTAIASGVTEFTQGF